MVVVLDEKQMLPAPPPYSCNPSGPPPFPGSTARPAATLAALPPHILLYIVHQTLSQLAGDVVERRRKVLHWMTISLRLVNRAMYIACMHVLRSTYLPAYTSMIKPPYTSDPFPLSSPGSPSPASHLVSPVNSVQRETQVLDLFLTAKVREDVWADDTELHLEREEAFQDLFDLLQPRARLEDLVRSYGVAAGVISVSINGNAIVSSSSAPSTQSSSTGPSPASPHALAFPHPFPRARGEVTRKVAFSALTCAFSPRSAGLVHTTRTGRRTIVEVPRARDERLEVAAKRLVHGLEGWVAENYSG